MKDIKITPKQKEIIILLYKFRFLDRAQIQKFLKHKDHKRINVWLKDLTEKNITGRHFSKSLKENKPAVYFLSTKAKKILQDNEDIDEKLLKRVYREKDRSNRFTDHCMFLADINLYLEDVAKKENSKLHFYTKTDLSKHYYLPYKRPDAYIAMENKSQTKRYFLEIIDEGTPRYMIRNKISHYVEYFEEGVWHEATGHPDPSILIVCLDETIQEFLFKYILKTLEEEAEEEISFYVTTKQEIRESKLEKNVWKLVDFEEDLPASK